MMRCPKCQASLGQINAAGEPMVRTRGLVLKADGVVAICPKCKGSVPMSPDFAKAMQQRMVVFIRRPEAA
jgi:uncharacterized protein with PIN domain